MFGELKLESTPKFDVGRPSSRFNHLYQDVAALQFRDDPSYPPPDPVKVLRRIMNSAVCALLSHINGSQWATKTWERTAEVALGRDEALLPKDHAYGGKIGRPTAPALPIQQQGQNQQQQSSERACNIKKQKVAGNCTSSESSTNRKHTCRLSNKQPKSAALSHGIGPKNISPSCRATQPRVHFWLLAMMMTALTTGVVDASYPPGRPQITSSVAGRSGGFTTPTTEEEIDMGTTLVALKYKHGVVVGADTQTSASTYVSNRFARKLDSIVFGAQDDQKEQDDSNGYESSFQFEGNDETNTVTIVYDDGVVQSNKNVTNGIIQSSCVIARSGSAADTQYLVKNVAREFSTSPRWTRLGDMPSYHHSPTISQVAHFLRYITRETNDPDDGGGGGGSGGNQLQASLICAGYDETCSGGGCSGSGRIFAITPGGTILEEPLVSVSGSGSTFLLGYLDQTLKERMHNSNGGGNNSEDTLFDEDEAIDLVVKLIRLSISRDASSGGWIRIVVINSNGQRHLTFAPTINDSSGLTAFVGKNRQKKDEEEPVDRNAGVKLPGFADVTSQ